VPIRTALLALDTPKKLVRNTQVGGANVSETEQMNVELLHEGNSHSRIAGMGVSSNFCEEEKHCGNCVVEKECGTGLSRWSTKSRAVEDGMMHHRNKFAQMKDKHSTHSKFMFLKFVVACSFLVLAAVAFHVPFDRFLETICFVSLLAKRLLVVAAGCFLVRRDQRLFCHVAKWIVVECLCLLEHQHSSPNRIQSLTDPVRHSCDRSLKTDITSPKHGEAKTQKTNTNDKRQQLSL